MDKLVAMRAFVEICDRGSLTAAAERLGKSQPTMVRTLANLEQALGVRLLRRTTRRLSLTEEGRAYLAQCRRILGDVEAAERSLRGDATAPRGQLRITAPVTFGQRHLMPVVIDFLQHYPEVQIDLLLLDRVVNLLEEGVDLAVRIGPLPDSSLIATGVGSMRRVLTASPGLLESFGRPEHPRQLEGAPAVLFRGLGAGGRWQFHEAGKPVAVTVRRVLATNQAPAAVAATAAGLGFGVFLGYQVAPELEGGALRLLLDGFEPPAAPVSLLYSDARLMSPNLRLLIDFVRTRLEARLAALNRHLASAAG